MSWKILFILKGKRKEMTILRKEHVNVGLIACMKLQSTDNN